MLVRNACAQGQGVRDGMSLSAACALVPHLVYRQRNRATEAITLNQLATWAGQYTPSVSLQPPDGLLLEIEGSLKLLGGMRSILAAIKRGCADMGYTVVLAVAPAVSAAWLLARARIESIVVAKIALRDAISALPVAVLDCDERQLAALDAIGIRSVGELLALPRAGVARRFGQQMLDQIDRALGMLPEARTFFAIPPRFEASLEFACNVAHAEALLFSARRLLTQLSGFLIARCGGVQRFAVTLLHEDIAATVLEIGLATPTRDLERFVILVRERFAAVSLAAPVRQIRIEADEIFTLAGSTTSLFPDPAQASGDCHRLIERLRARLGPDVVYGLSCCAEYRPELAWKTTPPGSRTPSNEGPLRPVWLLEEPRMLREVGSKPHYEAEPLSVVAGPEIIETGWWNGDIKRDYFVAQTPALATYWIYRERRAPYAWYLHGVFG